MSIIVVGNIPITAAIHAINSLQFTDLYIEKEEMKTKRCLRHPITIFRSKYLAISNNSIQLIDFTSIYHI